MSGVSEKESKEPPTSKRKPMQHALIQVMPVAMVAPEEMVSRGEPSHWLGRWMGERLTGLQVLAARRARTIRVNPRRFDVFEAWSMPITLQNLRRRG